ncbi:MAG: DUF4012 domain-containing protein [Microbacterium sp.]|uniref:DUF4012 domain-containing protein n=1 Tax=Microbacterium sp. TaxID=51671 RepID=UPI0039E59FE9
MAERRAMRPDGRVARRPRPLVVVLVTVGLVLVGAIGWLVFRGLQAKDGLEASVSDAKQLTAAVGAGDFAAADKATSHLAQHSGDAAGATGDPVWRVAESVPLVGPNLTAVRVAAEQAHALATGAAEPVLDAAQTLLAEDDASDALLNVAALRDAEPALARADDTVDTAADALAQLDASALLPTVADGVTRLRGAVEQAGPAVHTLAQASSVVPTILGADERRRILLMVQNNAELRTGGGITGTFIELAADNGALSIVRQADSSDFPRADNPPVPLPRSTTALYGATIGEYVQNVSITADFVLTGQLASAWWKERFHRAPDTVVSVDPVVLQAVLRALGPVKTPDGKLTADNLVERLLVEPYQKLSQSQQTKVFEHAASAVFTKLTRGTDPMSLTKALAEPLDQGRVSVWSSHEAEQDVLAQTPLAGPAARQRAAGRDAYAVYFNDATGGKMDTFLDVSIAGSSGRCEAGGSELVEVSVTLKNTAPAQAGKLFPTSVTGGGQFGTKPGDIATSVAVSGPSSAFFGAVTVDGKAVGPVQRNDNGFMVSATQVTVAPGESTTVAFRFATVATEPRSPTILHTPLISEPKLAEGELACG